MAIQQRSINKLLALGFDTDLIDKCRNASLSLSSLRGMNKVGLIHLGFTPDECQTILAKVNRVPISNDVMTEVLLKSGEVCCYCCDGFTARPYQIHHIEEYHQSQDNQESNLMLVCPTHHVTIHANKVDVEEQRLKKKQWEQLWEIASVYHDKGMIFPFSSFGLIDYDQTGAFTDIFNFGSPPANTCVRLLDNENGASARRILDKQHRIILAGSSGSGKTTFAKGLAGTMTGYSVFDYGVVDSPNAVTELLTFFSLAVKKILVIVDNANTSLTDKQLEQILSAATENKKIIVVNTRLDRNTPEEIEQHFLSSVFLINWNILKGGIRKFLMSHEHDLINYLDANHLNNAPGYQIGEGIMNKNLSVVIDEYARSVETVWQFFYSFSSGIERLNQLQADLFINDRMDLLVFYIAIQQIAQTENGTTTTALLALYNRHSALTDKAPPEREYLLEQLQKLQKWRIIKVERGRYNTVHRQFAANYIENLHFRDKPATEELLFEIFDNPERVKDITILWSWLNNISARSFIGTWANRLTPERWKALVDNACQQDLRVVSMLADRMADLLFSGKFYMKEAFDNRAATIAAMLDENEEGQIYFLRRLFMSLNRVHPQLIKDIAIAAEDKLLANLIKHADPQYFSDAQWLFNSICTHYPEWIFSFRQLFEPQDFNEIIKKVKKGDVDSLKDVLEFQRRYIHQVKRSQFKIYVQKFAEILQDCGLVDIRFSISFSGAFGELYYFPDDVSAILNSLDTRRLSSDFTNSPPRYWNNLSALTFIANSVHSSVIQQIIDGIDTSMLGKNINRYYQSYHYELRVFIYELAHGSAAKRIEFSAMLLPYVKEILLQNGTAGSDNIFEAFNFLDPIAAQRLAVELNIEVPETIIMPGAEDFEEPRRYFEELEKKGHDYYLHDGRDQQK